MLQSQGKEPGFVGDREVESWNEATSEEENMW